jgi:hypothetical protein
VERILSRALIAMATAVAAIILVATAAIFFGAALYFFLVSLAVAPALAALLVGFAGLMLAGLIPLATQLAQRRTRTARGGTNTGSADPGQADNLNDFAARLGSLAAQQASGQARAHPYRSFVVALIAGLAIGGSPELRSMLEKLLKN